MASVEQGNGRWKVMRQKVGGVAVAKSPSACRRRLALHGCSHHALMPDTADNVRHCFSLLPPDSPSISRPPPHSCNHHSHPIAVVVAFRTSDRWLSCCVEAPRRRVAREGRRLPDTARRDVSRDPSTSNGTTDCRLCRKNAVCVQLLSWPPTALISA